MRNYFIIQIQKFLSLNIRLVFLLGILLINSKKCLFVCVAVLKSSLISTVYLGKCRPNTSCNFLIFALQEGNEEIRLLQSLQDSSYGLNYGDLSMSRGTPYFGR